jgi:hypothetical protein
MTSRRAGPAVFGWAALLTCALAGCGTVYRPTPSPRVGLVIHGGGAWYVKDGHETAIGPLGGDLQALVGTDADAAHFATRARHQLAVGVPAYVCGLAAVVVGVAIAKPAGWIVAGAGAGVTATGIVLMGAGAVNAVDAVNVYNDRATASHVPED